MPWLVRSVALLLVCSAALARSEPVTDVSSVQALTLALLDPGRAPASLSAQVVELTDLLHRGAMPGLPGGGAFSDGETRTHQGLALSPAEAAQCAADAARTVVFIRGLHAAITEAVARFPDRPVRVLYVGSGPYALLATPLMSVWSPQQAQFTVLDIHEPSIRSAQTLIEGLGLTDSVRRFEIGDALAYQVSADPPPDVIVMEIMTAALESEPQVAITRHLLQQAPDALLVPESIVIEAYWTDPATEFTQGSDDAERVYLGKVFELSPATVASWQSLSGDSLPAAVLGPAAAPGPGYVPMLFTTIQARGEHVLRAHDSGLTMPRMFPGGGLPQGEVLRFYYQLGERPGLRALAQD